MRNLNIADGIRDAFENFIDQVLTAGGLDPAKLERPKKKKGKKSQDVKKAKAQRIRREMWEIVQRTII